MGLGSLCISTFQNLLVVGGMLNPSASLALEALWSLVSETFRAYPAGEDAVISAPITVSPWPLSLPCFVRLTFVGCVMFLLLLIVYLQLE